MAAQPTLKLDDATLAAVKQTKMTPVTSLMVKSIGYYEPSRILRVQFMNEKVYLYANITRRMFAELARSESKGTWLVRNIKAQQHSYPFMPEPLESHIPTSET